MNRLGHVRGSIMLVGASTGGHLVPAVAVGRELVRRKMAVILVSRGDAVERTILKDAGIPLATISVSKINQREIGARLVGIATIPIALFRAIVLLLKIRPSVVAGFGGFTSGPLLLCAVFLGIPTILFEANAIPGLTHRLVAPFVKRILVATQATADTMGRSRCLVTGSPLRESIAVLPAKTQPASRRRILVLGGSQGSRFLNENVPLLLNHLAEAPVDFEVWHQAGNGNRSKVAEAYSQAEYQVRVDEYIQDMRSALEWADFIISRSGAGAVSEVTAVGIPALFVPFASAADDHQAFNAKAVVDVGGALMVREGEWHVFAVAEQLAAVLSDAKALEGMATASRGMGRRDGLERIAATIEEMVN